MNIFIVPLLLFLFLLLLPAFAYGTGSLNNKLHVILSPLPQYTTSFSWGQPLKMMNDLNHYDAALTPRLRNPCNAPTQNGHLIVAPSEGLTPYLFARIAQLMASNAPQFKHCRKFTTAEIKTAPLIAGHSYVGDVEKAWQKIILTTAKEEQVIFFLPNLEALLGLGSHEHKRTGLEIELTASLQGNAIRLVTFLSEDQYKHILEDEDQKYAYVLESFGPPLFIQDFTFKEWNELTKAYLKTLPDDWRITDSDLQYFFDLLTNYHHNQSEPKRTSSFLQELISNLSMNHSMSSGEDADKETSYPLDIKKEDNNGQSKWVLSYPESRSLLLHFNTLFLDGNPSYTATGLSSFKPALRIYNYEYSKRYAKEHEWTITCDEEMIQLCLDQKCYSIPSGSHIHFSTPRMTPGIKKKISFTVTVMGTNIIKKDITLSKALYWQSGKEH